MLYLIAWLTDCALILFVFTGTRVLAEEKADTRLLGALGAAFFLTSALSNAGSGWLSDRIGRRVVSVSGALCLIGALSLVALFHGGGWPFYAAYICVGLAVGQIYPPVIAQLSQGTEGRDASRRFLFFGLAFNWGIVCGQVGGGWLYYHLGRQAPLLVAIGMACGTLLCLLLLRIPGEHDASGARSNEKLEPDERGEAQLFTRLGWAANFAGMFSMSVLWFVFPDLAVEQKMTPIVHGVVVGAGRATVMGVYLVMHLWSFWQFRFRFSFLTQCLGVTGMIIVAVVSDPWAFGLGVVLLSLLMGYNYFGSLFYNRRANVDARKGRAFGINEASLGLGATGGSLLGGWAAGSWGIRAPYWIAAMLIMSLLLVQLIVIVPRVRGRREPQGKNDSGL